MIKRSAHGRAAEKVFLDNNNNDKAGIFKVSSQWAEWRAGEVSPYLFTGLGSNLLQSHSPEGLCFKNKMSPTLSYFDLDFLLFMGKGFKAYNLSWRHIMSNLKDDCEI